MRTKLLFTFMLLSIATFGQQNPIQIDANGLTQALTAGGIVVRGQIVKINSAGQVVPVLTTDTSGAIGIAATSQTSAGNGVAVSIGGSPLVQVDGSCAPGNLVGISSTIGGSGHCGATVTGQVGIALTAANNGFAQVQWTGGGGSGGGGISSIVGPLTFAAVSYGVKADGVYVFDATWTNTQNTVSCPNNDCNFTAADNNKICWGISTTGTNTVPVGILVVTGAQAATCSTATGSQVANGTFAWCTDDTNAWITLRNAYYASQRPAFIEGPGGLTCVTKAPLRDTRANTTNAAMWAPSFQSPSGMTIFIPTPTFDFTTCSTPSAGMNLGCFWDTAPTGATNQNNLPQYGKVQNLGVNGLGFNALPGASNGVSAAAFQRVEGSNIWLWNWGSGAAGFSCASVTAPNSFYNLNVNSCGSVGIGTVGGGNNSLTWLVTSYVGGSGMATLLKANSGANVISKGSYYLTGCTTQCLVVNSGAVLTMDGDQVNGASGNQFMDVAGNAFLINNVQFVASNNSGHAILTRATGKVFVKGSSISETGTGGIAFNVNLVPGGSIINEGDNTIVGIDQTALTAAMVVPSAGWGTTATVTAPTGSVSSNPTRFSFQVNSSGTGQAANPTLVLTYPSAGSAPTLTCKQSGGTQSIAQISGENTATATTMTLTYNGTPVAGNNVVITCTGSLQ